MLSNKEIQEILENAKLAGEDVKEIMDMILTASLAGDDQTVKDIKDYLILGASKQIAEPDPFNPYPKQEEFEGNLTLGQTKGATCKAKEKVFSKHMFVSGATGAGKTTQAYGMIQQLRSKNIQVLSLGVKQDMRHFACKHGPMLVLRCSANGNFSIGDIFAAPQNVNTVDYQSAVIKCFCQSAFIAEAGQSLLTEVVNTIREREGYVCLLSLIRYLKKRKGRSSRENDWISTSLNRLIAFYTKFGSMFVTRDPFPFERVIERFSIELELDGAEGFMPFFAMLPMLRIYKYRIANNIRPNRLMTAVFCDEVNILASKTAERHAAMLGSVPMLLEYLPLSREFGIGFILYSNQPSEASNVLKAQAGIKMAMYLGEWNDIHDVCNSMILTNEQMKVVVDLPPGYAVVKMQGLSPFPIKIPNFEIKKDVTNDMITENNRRLLKGTEWENFLIADSNVRSAPPVGDAVEEIDEVERAFLFDIHNRPFVGSTERFTSVGIPTGTGSRLCDSLVNRCLVRMHEINLSGRGHKTKFYEISKKGYKALGISPKLKYGKGAGFLHKLAQYLIAQSLGEITDIEKTTIEETLQDKAIDVSAITTDGKRIGIEIAMTSVNELINMRKDLKAECDYVIVACKNKYIMQDVNKLATGLNDDEKNRIVVCIIYQLLKCKTLSELFSLNKCGE